MERRLRERKLQLGTATVLQNHGVKEISQAQVQVQVRQRTGIGHIPETVIITVIDTQKQFGTFFVKRDVRTNKWEE